jgi:transmembrane sensor
MMSLKAQARAWRSRLMTTDDRVTAWCLFQIWWNASELNRQAFREVLDDVRRDSIVRVSPARGEAVEEEVANPLDLCGLPMMEPSEAARSPKHALPRIAVVLVAGVLLYFLFKTWGPAVLAGLEPGWQHTENGRDAQARELKLSDQSILLLGADTAIRWRFTKKQRSFVLERGRVLFTVYKDGRSFSVQAGASSIEARGTIFQVALEKPDAREQVWTHVSSGEVTVTPQPSARFRTVSAGQALRIHGDEVQLESEIPDWDARLLWTGDIWKFRGAPLPAVVAAFNQYNPQQLQIVDPRLATKRVSGQFRGHDLRAFVRRLETSGLAEVVPGSDPHSAVIPLQAAPTGGTAAQIGNEESQSQ